MISLYTGFDEMQELYNSFQLQSDILQDHHTRRTATIKAFEDVIGWKTHIRETTGFANLGQTLG